VYLNHWSLERPPFEARPDSRFLFLTEQLEPALAAISYAACDGGEPVLLRGATGCGKTLLLRALRRKLPRERYHVAFVPEVACSQVSLLRRVAYHLSHALVDDAAAAMDSIWRQAQDAEARGQTMVVMLDDWPADAADATLEELRWLLNLDVEGGRLSVLLAGEDVRPEDHWPTWLVQRLFTTTQVGPLRPGQVPAYLGHRLSVAAAQPPDDRPPDETFAPEAAALIAEWSAGIPRLINRVAHLALQVASLDLAKRVEAEAVQRAISRLMPDLDAPQRKAPLSGLQSGALQSGGVRQ
jgi:type II secretory pathway predicted ATPase ExeA